MGMKNGTRKNGLGNKQNSHKSGPVEPSTSPNAAVEVKHQRLVSAQIVEQAIGLKSGTLYKMSRLRLVPCFRVGTKKRGLLFDLQAVLASLYQPAVTQPTPTSDEAKG